MAFIRGDSCDHYNRANHPVKWDGFLNFLNGSANSVDVVVLSTLVGTYANIEKGTQAIRLKYTGSSDTAVTQSAGAFVNFNQSNNELFISASLYIDDLSKAANGAPLIAIKSGLGAAQVYIEISHTGILSFWRNSTSTPNLSYTQFAGSLVLPLGRWVGFLLKIVFDAAAGSITIWLDGTAEGSPDLVIEGINTDVGLTGVGGTLLFGLDSNFYRGRTTGVAGGNGTHTAGFFVRDVVLWDGSGSTWNGHRNTLFLEKLGLTAQGNYDDWTRAGTDSGANFSQVNELVAIDNAAQYLKASATGTKDSYIVGDSIGPAASVVAGVLVTVVGEKEAGGSGVWRGLMRLGGVDGFGSEVILPAGWAFSQSLHETDPSAGAISVQDINDAEWGMDVVTP